jgi:hypothetical protein
MPAKFGPSTATPFTASAFGRGGSKNNPSTMRAKKRTRCAAHWLQHHCRFCVRPRKLLLRGTLLIFAAATDPGAWHSRKPLMRRVKDGGAKCVAKATPEKRTARSRGSRTWAVLMPEGAPSYTPPRHCLDDAEPRLTDR